MSDGLARDGWRRFAADAATSAWAVAALAAGKAALARGGDWRAGGTWFVGLDALDNDPDGRVGDVPLAGAARDAAVALFGALPLHRAQLSVVRPGYPQREAGESDAAFAFRRDRDAAHVDGLVAEGPARRRRIAEPHAWILGVALNDAADGASPLAVWDGSHRLVGAALRARLAGVAGGDLGQEDITDAYQAARRQAFASCRRRLLPLARGEAVLLHRHLIHGVSPWQDGAVAPAEGRVIAYFRPEAPSVEAWLQD